MEARGDERRYACRAAEEELEGQDEAQDPDKLLAIDVVHVKWRVAVAVLLATYWCNCKSSTAKSLDIVTGDMKA